MGYCSLNPLHGKRSSIDPTNPQPQLRHNLLAWFGTYHRGWSVKDLLEMFFPLVSDKIFLVQMDVLTIDTCKWCFSIITQTFSDFSYTRCPSDSTWQHFPHQSPCFFIHLLLSTLTLLLTISILSSISWRLHGFYPLRSWTIEQF